MGKYLLTIGWLYPDLMSTYGDRGNIICFKKRCERRGIDVEIIPIDQTTANCQMQTAGLIFGGGAQDRQQEIVMKDLAGNKGKIIKELIEKQVPALFVCGSHQLMGKYYEPSFGRRIEGLEIFDMVSIHPGTDKPRCVGNIVVELNNNYNSYDDYSNYLVGYENHGGRTYLGENAKPFAKVIKGFGNNGQDGTEGVVYKNALGSYLHGPLLPKNPHLADWLIKTALEVKYRQKIELDPLNDELEWKAHRFMLNRLKAD